MIGLPDLTWHPKPNGAGDIDGAGSKRLLGQPELDLVNLMVRETAQNSWDARRPGTIPHYEVRLRDLGESHLDVLRWNVFNQTAPDSTLGMLLERGIIDALEIADRNTIGLGGSLRNDIDTEGARDWADFVLAVGAPPDKGLGGGTYGFGKTASYVASRCSTILIWSAVEHEGGIQHRFIASAMDNGFSIDGQRFTGRQWWGNVIEDEGPRPRVEPVLGDDAQQLGEALFERHFHPGETGTSLMILAPWPPEEQGTLDDWAQELPRAVMHNLWPKLGSHQPPERRMEVQLFDRGREICLPLGDSVVLQALQRCLDAVRDQKTNSEFDSLLRGYPVQSLRPKQVLGHVALTRFVAGSEDPLKDLCGRVGFMRWPELVVRSQEYPADAGESLQWVGVFKPLDSLNSAFASAEPPAHDMWAPESVRDRADKRAVNIALREIKAHVKTFHTPVRIESDAEESVSTAAVSASLAALAGTAIGSRPAHASKRSTTASSRRGDRSVTSRVSVTAVTPLPRTDADVRAGIERSRIDFNVTGDSLPCSIQMGSLRVAIDGSAINGGDDVYLVQWASGSRQRTIEVETEGDGWCEVAYPPGVAVEFSIKVGA